MNKEVTFAQNINNKKGAELINFYLVSNNAMLYLLSIPRGIEINTEIEFPDQPSLGPKVLHLTDHFFKKIIYLFIFIFGCVGSLLLCAGFLWLQRAGSTLRCSVRASHFGGFSLLRSMGSRCSGFSSCSRWAQQLWLTASRVQAQ